MPASLLLLIALVTLGCGDDAASDGQPDAGPVSPLDVGADAGPDGVPLLESRSEPECESLGSERSASSADFRVQTDFFATCGSGSSLADRAFTWTAPELGLYAFRLGDDGGYDGRRRLELRRGACVLTQAEGAPEALAEAPQCVTGHLDEAGFAPLWDVLRVESGETITILAEGDDFYFQDDPRVLKRQTLSVHVEPADCPGVEQVSDSGELREVQSLPVGLPLAATLMSRVGDDELRPLSCSTAGYTRQFGVSWTAPAAGRFRVEVEGVDADARTLALGVFDDSCTGDELACARDASAAATTLTLDAGQRVVLFVELGDPSYDDARLELRIGEAP